MRSGGQTPACANPVPHSRAVTADRSLTEVNPTLRESWVPLSHLPLPSEDPGVAVVQAEGTQGASLLALLTAPPRQGLSQHRVLGQARLSRARLTARDGGLMYRQAGFTAAGVLWPGVGSA